MEIVIDDVEYDRGYGVVGGTIVVDVSPVKTDESFDAHGLSGSLQSFGGLDITDFDLDDGVIFLIGNNGEELGEESLTKEELLKYVNSEYIIEKLQSNEG